MDDVVIRAEGLSKRYQIGRQAGGGERYAALRDVVGRQAKGLFRSVRSMAKGRQIVAGDEVEEFWALKDVSFEIKRGEVVGIIGRNGAGKSTLLKVLSRITEPSAGRVEIKGRIASLLEVGTGFHPELSGRENIYLNGAILGMSRAEIRRKFDEIVAFAEVAKFLDTPVKRYSSGMYVRLAFAVAAHLEPEILVVDEVLAVGDAEFQKKCLGKMQDVAGHGRTVLFVSHNTGSLESLCSRGILLSDGRLACSGEIGRLLREYRSAGNGRATATSELQLQGPLRSIKITSIHINGAPSGPFIATSSQEGVTITAYGDASDPVSRFHFSIAIFTQGMRLFTIHDEPSFLPKGSFSFEATIPPQFLRPGIYTIGVGGRRVGGDEWCWCSDAVDIEILPKWDVRYAQDQIGLINTQIPLTRATCSHAGCAPINGVSSAASWKL